MFVLTYRIGDQWFAGGKFYTVGEASLAAADLEADEYRIRRE